MIHTRHLGDVRITNLIEYYGPTHDPFATFPDFDKSIIVKNRDWLTNAYWYENLQRLVIAIQIWIVHFEDKVILIDAGVGNLKDRPAKRMHRLNSLVPQWLAAAGASYEQVTHVVMTHLHGDHVGWNTVPDGDKWAPAFPNAEYFLPAIDFSYFKAQHDKNPQGDPAFADSVLPLLDTAKVTFVESGNTVAGCLRAVDAVGHTPGQLNYWIGAGEAKGVFSADIFHHPLQIYEPQLNTAFCILPDQARKTRMEFLNLAADEKALVMPCHFGPPHCGHVQRTAQGFAFVPHQPELPQFN